MRLGFVYLITDDQGNYKIGITRRSVKRRLSSLSTPAPLRIVAECCTPGYRELEGDLHFRFRHCRTNREWFRLSDSEVEQVLVSFREVHRDPPIAKPRKEADVEIVVLLMDRKTRYFAPLSTNKKGELVSNRALVDGREVIVLNADYFLKWKEPDGHPNYRMVGKNFDDALAAKRAKEREMIEVAA